MISSMSCPSRSLSLQLVVFSLSTTPYSSLARSWSQGTLPLHFSFPPSNFSLVTSDDPLLFNVPTNFPSSLPSYVASSEPHVLLSQVPSSSPSNFPNSSPSKGPTLAPSSSPRAILSEVPSSSPSNFPNFSPSKAPTLAPSSAPSSATSSASYFRPSSSVPSFSPSVGVPTLGGETLLVGNLAKKENGIYLSEGLEIRLLAIAGDPITLKNGNKSDNFHQNPDGAGCIAKNDDSGAYYYVSNAENVEGGGVWSLEISSEGDMVSYKNLINKTKRNCGGGRSPYGTWLSGEEVGGGHVWDCNPNKNRCRKTRLGGESGGRFEAVAYCCYDGCYYVTEDHAQGALRQFCPNPGLELKQQLHSDGFNMSYLMFKPKDTTYEDGNYSWDPSFDSAKENAQSYYPLSEGISCRGKFLHFTTKANKMLLTLNLETGEYKNETTYKKFLGGDGVANGEFLHQPDQILHMENHVDVCPENNTDDDPDLLLFAEDGGRSCGLYIRDEDGKFCTLVEADEDDERWKGDETSGICRSPDGSRLHFVIQEAGYLFELTRSDGGKFSKLKCAEVQSVRSF